MLAPPPPTDRPEPPLTEDNPRLLFTRAVIFQGALALGGLIAFFFLLLELSDFMTPLLMAAAGLILVWPLREHRVMRGILLAGGFLTLVWLINQIGMVLLPFAVVYLLAYLFDPAVTAANERWSVPRWITTLMLTLLSVGVLVLFVVLIVPNLIGQIEVLATRLIGGLADVQFMITNSRFVAYLDEAGMVSRAEIEARLATLLTDQLAGLSEMIPAALQGIYTSIGSILSIITTVTLVPVMLFYTLRDYPYIQSRIVEVFPTVRGRRDYLTNAGKIVGGYMRGQITISIIAAFNVSVVLLLLDIPFALLIGMLTGVLNMIPNIGIIITNIVAVLIGLVFGDPWLPTVLTILVVIFLQQVLETTILSPNILSYHVGLHPVLVILSLFVFGSFMGLIGLIVAVPLTALILTFYRSYRDQMKLDLTSAYPDEPGSRLILPTEARISDATLPTDEGRISKDE